MVSKESKVNLINRATPLEFLPRLTEYLNGPKIYVKRDDIIGRGGGGNKVRKYERIIGDAISQNCDTLIIAGHFHSNAARTLVGSASQLGLKPIVVCKDLIPEQNDAFFKNGNALLMNIMDAEIIEIGINDDYTQAMKEVAENVKKKGGNPYVIPFGGSNILGALGYVDCAEEITNQFFEQELTAPDYIVVTTGSGGTQAGLLAGLANKNIVTKVIGFSVLHSRNETKKIVLELTEKTIKHLNRISNSTISVITDDAFLGEGYGIPTTECLKTIKLLAKLEGLFLCPVYTGKAMAGLISYIKSEKIPADKNVVFVHTGGSPMIYAYYDKLYH
ncbi:MAG: D-cysteine desulfhydrase family protein [Bacteroidales bacterium]